MRRRNRRLNRHAEVGEWSPTRLRLLLAATLAVLCALCVGAVWSITTLLQGPGHAGQGAALAGRDGADQSGAGMTLPDDMTDELTEATAGSLTSDAAGRIQLPAASRTGPAGVPSGFPQTAEGALAQLVALDRAALEALSVPRAQDVIAQWAAPGGPDAATWSVVRAVADLLTTAGQPASGTTRLALRADASMALYASTPEQSPEDGALPSTATPCVLFLLTLTTTAGEHQIAAADCQRLTWHQGRWIIDTGPEPALSPSVWPGTQAAVDAGYRWIGAGT
jgi:hypothetical protein